MHFCSISFNLYNTECVWLVRLPPWTDPTHSTRSEDSFVTQTHTKGQRQRLQHDSVVKYNFFGLNLILTSLFITGWIIFLKYLVVVTGPMVSTLVFTGLCSPLAFYCCKPHHHLASGESETPPTTQTRRVFKMPDIKRSMSVMSVIHTGCSAARCLEISWWPYGRERARRCDA